MNKKRLIFQQVSTRVLDYLTKYSGTKYLAGAAVIVIMLLIILITMMMMMMMQESWEQS